MERAIWALWSKRREFTNLDKQHVPANWDITQHKLSKDFENVLKVMFLEVDEPGFDPLDRIELLRIGRLQLGRYLLDLCGGNFPEVSIGTVTENGLRKSDSQTTISSSGDPSDKRLI
jgi:hypothetical protein